MTTEHPHLDVDRLLDVLQRHDVAYLLVGGLSALARGATRPTDDFDCLPERSAPNLDRLAAALRDLGARLRVGGLSDEEAKALPVVIDASTLRSMEISTWRTDAGDLDVLAAIPDREGHHVRFDELRSRASTLPLGSHAVMVAALDDVIASKEWADRPKDHDALPELRRLRDDERRPHDPS